VKENGSEQGLTDKDVARKFVACVASVPVPAKKKKRKTIVSQNIRLESKKV